MIIKRISIFLLAVSLAVSLCACGQGRQTSVVQPDEGSTGGMATNDRDVTNDNVPDIPTSPDNENNTPADSTTPGMSNGEANSGNDADTSTDGNVKKELLQSASIDLDADGINEQVKAVKASIASTDPEAAVRYEGRLEISDGDVLTEIVFWKKDEDLSGMMSSMQFEDMDGDGAKDIFIIIPGYGASFTYSNCFIYSYAKDKSCIFTSDNELADFIGWFRFAYEGGNGNKLGIINDQYGFSAMLAIEDIDHSSVSEDVMYDYADRSWIDPTSVDISESSKLALASSGKKTEIKVPLPIFGMATVNMIGEIDLYYSIDEDFRLVLERCEVIDFNGDSKIKAGSFSVKK